MQKRCQDAKVVQNKAGIPGYLVTLKAFPVISTLDTLHFDIFLQANTDRQLDVKFLKVCLYLIRRGKH